MPDPISWSFSWPYILAAFAFGYLCGSVPFGLILTRLAGRGDVRHIGSGNIGATNVLRTGSKLLAAGTLLFDALKGTIAVLLAAQFGPDTAHVAALGAYLGHVFPIWLRFRGGKGVATYLGVLLGLAPLIALAFATIWLLVAVIFRYSSLSALVAAVCTPIMLLISGEVQSAELFVVLTILVFWAHRANVKRLVSATEPRIHIGSGK